MKRTTYKSLRAGDLFSIPLPDHRCGIGNVLIPGAEMYICVYREVFASDALEDVPEIGALTPYLIGRTSDELFYHGRWHLLRRGAATPEFPKPFYVVQSNEGQVLKSFDAQTIRAADEADLRFYGRQTSFSNVTFARALERLHGVAEDDTGYDYTRLFYDRAVERAQYHDASPAEARQNIQR
jgi:hypothetical protein